MVSTPKAKAVTKVAKIFITLGPVGIGIIVLVLIFLIQSAKTQMAQIAEIYSSLTSKSVNSKGNVNKVIKYVDNEGKITFGTTKNALIQQQVSADTNAVYQEAIGTNLTLTADAQQIQSVFEPHVGKEHAVSFGLLYDYVRTRHDAGGKCAEYFTDNFYIGFVANCGSEGRYNTIEAGHDFWAKHSYSELPSIASGQQRKQGEPLCLTYADAQWFYKATDGWKQTPPGIGIVQWSGGRRDYFRKIMKKYIGDNNSNEIIPEKVWLQINFDTLDYELGTSGAELWRIENAAGVLQAHNIDPVTASCEAWCEALCEWYEGPGGSCKGPSGTYDKDKDHHTYFAGQLRAYTGADNPGHSCVERIAKATKYASYLQ